MSCADLTWFLILRGFVGAVLSCALLLLRASVCAVLSARFCLARFCYGAVEKLFPSSSLLQIWIIFDRFDVIVKIWVNPWNFEQILAVFFAFSPQDGVRIILKLPDYSTTPEYTIPENLVKIGRVVSENEGWIKKNKIKINRSKT